MPGSSTTFGRVEDSYVARIENLLVPMLGAGRVRTTVTTELDFTQREETQELYDPETIVRSEQVSEDRSNGAGLSGGIPGALSNQPPPACSARGSSRRRQPRLPPINAAIPPDAANAQASASSCADTRLTNRSIAPETSKWTGR